MVILLLLLFFRQTVIIIIIFFFFWGIGKQLLVIIIIVNYYKRNNLSYELRYIITIFVLVREIMGQTWITLKFLFVVLYILCAVITPQVKDWSSSIQEEDSHTYISRLSFTL